MSSFKQVEANRRTAGEVASIDAEWVSVPRA
jgi:hypothetical protein